MTTAPTTTSGAADLLDLIEAYAEARHRQGHSSYNAQTATALQAVKDALAAGQATAAPAQPAAQQGAAYAELPEYGINTASHAHFRVLGFTADQMRAFADATHTLRASHGQAPATQQAEATKEHVRLVRVIADKIEDGTLFRSGIYSNKDLARFVRNVADAAAPQFPTTQAQAGSVLEDAARYRFLRDGEWRDTDLEPFIRLQLNTLWDAKIDEARKQGEKQ